MVALEEKEPVVLFQELKPELFVLVQPLKLVLVLNALYARDETPETVVLLFPTPVLLEEWMVVEQFQ